MDKGFFSVVNILDLSIVIISFGLILTGIIRGFTSDILGLLTWVGAFSTTSKFFPFIQPFARTYISKTLFADITAAFLLFIISLIVLVSIAKGITLLVRKSMLSGLDRSLGIISGLFRSTVILTLLYFILLLFLKPGAAPSFVKEARFLPYLTASARLVHHYFIPEEFFPKRLLKHLYGEERIDGEEKSAQELVESLSNPKPGYAPSSPNQSSLRDTQKNKSSSAVPAQELDTLIESIITEVK